MRTNTLIIFILFAFVKINAITPLPPEKPKVIINLVIDNFSDQEIEQNKELLSSDGILKLRNEGTRYTNATYPYSSTSPASDYASISTGCTPRYHGIVSEQWFSPKTDDYESCIESKNIVLIGNGNEKEKGYDANRLIASTLGDELKIYNHGESKVFSVSLNHVASVLLGGHAADGAYWLDNISGKWITSDYYMSWLPDWVEKFNNKNFAEFYLTQEWVLSQSPDKYNINKDLFDEKTYPIALNEYKDEKEPYKIISSTPMGTMFIVDFVTELIKNEQVGKDNITDLLFINFSSITNNQLNKGQNSIEKADYLIKLDKEIAKLIELLNKEIGSNNYLITLTGTQPKGLTVDELQKQKMPSGIFNPERAKALLNSYLMALYGQGNWVLNFSNQQIFLNEELIIKSRLNLNDFQETVASFMEEFSGVKWAIPAYKLKYADFNEGYFSAMQESYFPGRCGNIMISYYPGWAEESNNTNTNFTYSHNNSIVPLIIYGWKIERKTINSKIYLTGLSPTLSTYLNIPIPNSSSKNLIYLDIEK